MSQFKSWKPTVVLERYFTPTNMELYGEVRKARYKNYNLPILQLMYNGDELKPLCCLISNDPGWKDIPCIISKTPKQRFNIDFNHIRQKQNGDRRAGHSIDKSISPSAIYRAKHLDMDLSLLFEFICVMPLSQEMHQYVTQDSALGDITLQNFDPKHWSWILKSKENYNDFFNKFNINNSQFSYNWIIDHLSDIDHPPIFERLRSA